MAKKTGSILPIWSLACMAYRLVLRDLLLRAVEDPDEEWDDMVLDICDRIFGCTVD